MERQNRAAVATRLELGTPGAGEVAEWIELADRTGAAPFMRPGWTGAWIRHFGGALELARLMEDDHCVALTPLVVSRGVLRSPTNWHTPSHHPIASRPDAVRELAASLGRRTTRYLDLGFIPVTGPYVDELTGGARAAGLRVETRPVMSSPYVATADRDWERYLETLPSRRLSKYRRFERRLAEEGALEVEIVGPGDEHLGTKLAEGFAIEGSGWKSQAGTAIVDSESTLGFYSEIARWASTEGLLRLWFLRLDGRAVAFALCLEDERALYELKVGFDRAWARHGPGVLLTRARLRHVFDAGLERYEFLGGPDRHKLDWTDDRHELVRIQAFQPIAGTPDRYAWTHGRRIVQRIRSARHREGNQ